MTSARSYNKVGHLFWFTILGQHETNDVIMYIHSVHKHRGNSFQRKNNKMRLKQRSLNWINSMKVENTAGNRHKQNSWFCKEIREDNFRFWWRRVQEDASQGMYMSKIEIFFFTARILQNQRMLCCGEWFHD